MDASLLWRVAIMGWTSRVHSRGNPKGVEEPRAIRVAVAVPACTRTQSATHFIVATPPTSVVDINMPLVTSPTS
jgi:hypothetical protein